jgi:hypothetical protein
MRNARISTEPTVGSGVTRSTEDTMTTDRTVQAVSAVEELITTRRSLHGIAECLLAGPEHRASGEIALRVTDDGFATTAGPELGLAGNQIITGTGRRVPARGTFTDTAAALGVEFGPPDLGYPDGSGVASDDEIILDPVQLPLLLTWFTHSAAALRLLAPDQQPILWPEHFDVAVLIDNHSYGSSPGDETHPRPYAYVSTRDGDGSDFFNAPFGALRPAESLTTVDDLLAFWREGLARMTR